MDVPKLTAADRICLDFRELFMSELGKRCLKHLEKACYARSFTDISEQTPVSSGRDNQLQSFVDQPIDPIKWWRRDGMRAVYWLIYSSIEQSDQALREWERRKLEWEYENV